MIWMQTRDGIAVDLLKPDLTYVSIEEIAHSLARINRYTGHTRADGYSVAQHSVECCRHAPPGFELDCLLHDAHEAIIGDISSPVKRALEALGGGAALRTLDDMWMLEVAIRYGTRHPHPPEVKRVDLEALATERRDLMGGCVRPWNIAADGRPAPPWRNTILTPLKVHDAQELFLYKFRSLTGKWS